VARNNDFAGREVEAAVPFLLSWITEKNTMSGARGKLVSDGGDEIWVAQTPERAQMVVGGMNTVEEEVRGKMVNGAGGTKVE
jgi:hypothetical protein